MEPMLAIGSISEACLGCFKIVVVGIIGFCLGLLLTTSFHSQEFDRRFEIAWSVFVSRTRLAKTNMGRPCLTCAVLRDYRCVLNMLGGITTAPQRSTPHPAVHLPVPIMHSHAQGSLLTYPV